MRPKFLTRIFKSSNKDSLDPTPPSKPPDATRHRPSVHPYSYSSPPVMISPPRSRPKMFSPVIIQQPPSPPSRSNSPPITIIPPPSRSISSPPVIIQQPSYNTGWGSPSITVIQRAPSVSSSLSDSEHSTFPLDVRRHTVAAPPDNDWQQPIIIHYNSSSDSSKTHSTHSFESLPPPPPSPTMPLPLDPHIGNLIKNQPNHPNLAAETVARIDAWARNTSAYSSQYTHPSQSHQPVYKPLPSTSMTSVGPSDAISLNDKPIKSTAYPQEITVGHIGGGDVEEVPQLSFEDLLSYVAASNGTKLAFRTIESLVISADANSRLALLSLVGEEAQRVLDALQRVRRPCLSTMYHVSKLVGFLVRG
jgi:hypothetical protein